jgi:hypothetical protein
MAPLFRPIKITHFPPWGKTLARQQKQEARKKYSVFYLLSDFMRLSSSSFILSLASFVCRLVKPIKPIIIHHGTLGEEHTRKQSTAIEWD